MKKQLLFAIFFLAVFAAFGQKLPFQGKLIELGVPVDGTRTLEFSIASQDWSEIHAAVPITNGLYFVVLGSIKPLPDSLFYGVDEQSLDILVDGTALSPVILFKPLSTPYEGGELNVTNSEGNITGILVAQNDSLLTGELILNGPSGDRNLTLGGDSETGNTGALMLHGAGSGSINQGFKAWQGDAGIDLPFISLETRNNYMAYLSAFNNIDVNTNDTTSVGYMFLRSTNGHQYSIQPQGYWMYKDNKLTSQMMAQNWGGLGFSGHFDVRGPNSTNIALSSRHWENPDLPWFYMNGSSDQNVIQMSAETDEDESGNINILSKNGNSTYLSANRISSGNSSTQYYEFASQDWGGQGYTGLFKINGLTTQNFELTSQSWVNPNFPWFKLSGENLGDAVQMFLDNDGTEAANLKLFSLGRGSSSFTTDSWNMNGPNSGNIQLGTRHWEGTPDFPLINLFGENNFHGIELSITRDGENNQFGWINLMSENGKSLHLSPGNLGVEGVSISTSQNPNGNFGSFTLHGPNSDNFQLMPSWWENPDLPRMLLLGTSQIAAVDMGADFDDQQNEVGFIGISSTDGSSANWRPGILALNNTSGGQTIALETRNIGQGEFGELRLNGSNGNPALNFTQTGGAGWLSIFGESGGGIKSGFKFWEGQGGSNRPFQALEGTVRPDFGLILSHVTGDNTVEQGQIELHSTDGSRTDINAYELTFNNTQQIMSYNANGISGSGQLSIANGVNITGDVVVNGVTEHSSDRRFKKDIKSLAPNTLEKIQFIEGVSYNWRQNEFPEKNFSSDKQIGMIAQELEAQFPELVKTNKDGYKSVNYNGFTAVLLEAVKELNAKVEKLENENMQLKAELSASANNSNEINQLKQQMEMLSKMFQQNSPIENSSGNEIVSTPGLK